MKIFVFPYMTDYEGNKDFFYFIPDSCMVKTGNPVFIPDFDDTFESRPFVALKISKLGKFVTPKFAYRYYRELAPAFSIKAVSLLKKLKENNLPWTQAVIFDRSTPVGNFIPAEEFHNALFYVRNPLSLDDDTIIFNQTLTVPDKAVFEHAISVASRYNTIKTGDIILIPFHNAEDFTLVPDTKIGVSLNGEKLLEISVK